MPATAPTDLAVQYACPRRGLPARREFERWAQAALTGRDGPSELCIRVVDEAEGRELNARYRGRDYATNVLSFPAEPVPGVAEGLLGDVVLCAPVVRAEAAAQGRPEAAHWAHLTVHGILHLLGHQHDSDGAATAMEALEKRVLAALGFPDPYAADKLEAGQTEKGGQKASP